MAGELAPIPNAVPAQLATVQNPTLAPVDRHQYADPGHPTAGSLYSYLLQLGATRNQALMLTGAGKNESGLNPQATHDPDENGNPTGYGLFGHRLERRDAMFRATGTRTPNWQQQAAFALQELRSRPEAAMLEHAQTPTDITRVQMHYERPRGYSDAHPEGGDNYAGRLATINHLWTLDGSTPVAALPASATPGGSIDAIGEPFPVPAYASPSVPQPATAQPQEAPAAGAAPAAHAAPSPLSAPAPARVLTPTSQQDMYLALLHGPQSPGKAG